MSTQLCVLEFFATVGQIANDQQVEQYAAHKGRPFVCGHCIRRRVSAHDCAPS